MQPESHQLRPVVVAYTSACLLFGFSLWMALVLVRTAGREFLFLPISLSIAVSAVSAGPGPGVLTLLLATLAVLGSLPAGPLSPPQTSALTVFVAGWFGVCLRVRSGHRQLRHEREARADAQRTAAQFDRIAQLASALGRARTPIEVAEASVQESLHAMKADAGMLLLVREDLTAVSIARAVAYKPAVAAEHQEISLVTKSPLSDAVQRGAPVLLDSLNAWHAEYPDESGAGRYTDYEATAAIPLLIGHRVAAVVRLDFRQARAFTADDEHFLSVLTSHAAPVLDRAWQHEIVHRGRAQAEALRAQADRQLAELRRTDHALRASETRYRALATRTACMHDLTAALSEAVTVHAVAAAVIQHGSVLTGATTAAVAMLVQDGAALETLGADTPCVYPAMSGLCATEAIRIGEPIFVSSWAEWQERYWRSASSAADAGHLSSVTLPLRVEGRPIGVLEFHFRFPVNFDAEYRAMLMSVAQHCAQALDRARLYESAQQARAEAEAANRLKDDFLSILSHELRTPLNAVVGWASMLRQGSVKQEMTARAVQSIHDNAMRQTKLIDDLLDVSRMAAGQAMLDLQELDLAVLVAGVVESVIPAAASDQVEVIVRSMPAAIIMGDRRRLEQVFFNLLGNALKFTPAGGHVTIDASCEDRAVRIRVSDSGIGIERAFLPHVFDRFRQGDSSPTRTYGGLGLGLSIAKQLVEAHGGRITAESAGRNLGTTFSVTLPLIARTSAVGSRMDSATRHAPAAVEVPRLDGLRVLVVDDEADAREIMAHALRASGAHVVLAAGAVDALGILGSTAVDVLLADVAMPDADGYALIRRVRASADLRVAAIPAVAVTAHAFEAERDEALAAGFQDHLAKPVEPADLARAVDQLARGGPQTV